jgi:group I intron endonuclease
MKVIYKIQQISTGKVYIGMTSDYKRRRTNHLWRLRNKKHSSILLQRAFDKYGEDDFSFNIIEEVVCPVERQYKEEVYFKEYDCRNPKKGFNISPSGVAPRLGMKGYSHKWSDEDKERIKISQPAIKRVKNLVTGVIYDSIREASRLTGFGRRQIQRSIIKNKTRVKKLRSNAKCSFIEVEK